MWQVIFPLSFIHGCSIIPNHFTGKAVTITGYYLAIRDQSYKIDIICQRQRIGCNNIYLIKPPGVEHQLKNLIIPGTAKYKRVIFFLHKP